MDLIISKIILGSSFLLLFNVFLGCECLNLDSGTCGGTCHFPLLVFPLCVLKHCFHLSINSYHEVSGETLEHLPVPKGPPRKLERGTLDKGLG